MALSDARLSSFSSFFLCLSAHKQTFVLELHPELQLLCKPARGKAFISSSTANTPIFSHAKIKKIKCGLLCQFSVFIAFSENLKEMRGKEPQADWTNLGEPLGDCPGCLTQRRMTAAPANSERFGEAEGSSQTDVCQTLLHLQLGMGMNKISVIHLTGLILY